MARSKSANRLLAILITVSLAGGGCTGPLTEPEGTVPAKPRHSRAAEHLPATTMAYLSVVDLASMEHHLRQTQLNQLLAKSQAAGAVSSLPPETLRELPPFLAKLLPQLRSLLTGPITFAVMDLGSMGKEPLRIPRIALFLGISPGASTIIGELIEEWTQKPDRQGELSLETEATPRGQVYRIFKGPRLAAALRVGEGDLVLVTHEADLDLLTQVPKKSLAENPFFGKDDFWKESDIVGFLNLSAAVSQLFERLEEDRPKAKSNLKAAGMGALQAVSYMIRSERNGYLERLVIEWQSGEKSLVDGLLAPETGKGLMALQRTPPKTTAFLDFTVGSPLRLFHRITELEAKQSPDSAKETRQGLKEFREFFGFDLKNDFLRQLTGEAALVLQLPPISATTIDNPLLLLGYMSSLHLSLYLGVRDEAIIGECLEKLVAKTPITLRPETHRGIEIHYMSSPAPLPVIPVYTLHNGMLGFHINDSSATASLDAALDGRSLATDDDYRFVTRRSRGRKPCSIAYLRLGQILPLAAKLTRRAAQLRQSQGEATPEEKERLELLADLERFGGSLHGLGRFVWAKPGRLTMDTYAPGALMSGLVSVAGMSIVGAVAIPAFIKTRQKGRHAGVALFLRSAASAQDLYRLDRGHYAKSFDELVKAELLASIPEENLGYEFRLQLSGKSYSISARPISPKSGDFSFFLAEDGILRGGPKGGDWGDESLAVFQ